MKPDKLTGFQYTIEINQIGAINAGLPDSVDVKDLAIFDVLLKFSLWEGCKTIFENGKRYYYFDWEIIPKRAPRLKITSRSTVKDRIKTLCDCGLLEGHPDNSKLNQSWFAFGPKYALFHNLEPVRKNVTPSGNSDGSRVNPVLDSGDQSGNSDATRPEIRTLPVRDSGHNDNTFFDSTFIENDNIKPNPNESKFEEWKNQLLRDEQITVQLRLQIKTRKISDSEMEYMVDNFFASKALEPVGWTKYTDCRKNFWYFALRANDIVLKNFKNKNNADEASNIQPGTNQTTDSKAELIQRITERL